MEGDKRSYVVSGNQGLGTTGMKADPNLIPAQNVAENLHRITTHDAQLVTGNQNVPGSNFPIFKENEFVERNLGSEIGGQGLGTGMPMSTGGLAQSTNLTTEMPIIHSNEPMLEEGQQKKGLLSKITGIFHKHKQDKTAEIGPHETINEPPGILDEKGTTVTLTQSTGTHSQLGLPVLGPDYTHGTHGISEHTVFTGGQSGFGTSFMGPSTQGVATFSGPVDLSQGEPGLRTGVNQMGQADPNLMKGIDISGANATHIERDITLQEGGLLGLRQGAVTGNPGDIITNYFESQPTTKFQQPIVQPQPVIHQPATIIEERPQFVTTEEYTVVRPFEDATTRITTGGTDLGTRSCTLVDPHQKQL